MFPWSWNHSWNNFLYVLMSEELQRLIIRVLYWVLKTAYVASLYTSDSLPGDHRRFPHRSLGDRAVKLKGCKTNACVDDAAGLYLTECHHVSLSGGALFLERIALRVCVSRRETVFICEIEQLSGAQSPWGDADVTAVKDRCGKSRALKPFT